MPSVGKVTNVGPKSEMGKALAASVKSAMAKLKDGEKFTVALSGGSLPAVLNQGLSDAGGVDWSRWHVFFADERMVPLDHADSNYLACKKALFDKVSIPADQIYPVNTSLPIKEAAEEYAKKVAEVAPNGLSLLLLGMGPDGHTCSLFPNHELLTVTDRLVASITDSPKPPPERVTLTLPAVQQAGDIIFVAGGGEKADPLRRAVAPKPEDDAAQTPARIVHESGRAVQWIVDDAAASKL